MYASRRVPPAPLSKQSTARLLDESRPPPLIVMDRVDAITTADGTPASRRHCACVPLPSTRRRSNRSGTHDAPGAPKQGLLVSSVSGDRMEARQLSHTRAVQGQGALGPASLMHPNTRARRCRRHAAASIQRPESWPAAAVYLPATGFGQLWRFRGSAPRGCGQLAVHHSSQRAIGYVDYGRDAPMGLRVAQCGHGKIRIEHAD